MKQRHGKHGAGQQPRHGPPAPQEEEHRRRHSQDQGKQDPGQTLRAQARRPCGIHRRLRRGHGIAARLHGNRPSDGLSVVLRQRGLLNGGRALDRSGLLRGQSQHLGACAALRRSRDVHAQQGGQRRRDIDLRHVAVAARLHTGAGQHPRLHQGDRVLPAVAAAVDLAVIAGDEEGILAQIERRGDLSQQVVGAARGGIPARIGRPALVVAGIIHLIDVNQREEVIVGLQPRQRGVDHGTVSGRVFAGRVEAGIHRSLRDQALEPVVAGDRGLPAGALDGRDQVILRPGGDLGVVEVDGGAIAHIGPGAGEQRRVARLRIARRPAVDRRRRAAAAQLVQKRHHIGLERRILAQGVDQDEDHPPGQGRAQRFARRRRRIMEQRPVSIDRVHQARGPEIRAGSDQQAGQNANQQREMFLHRCVRHHRLPAAA